MHKYQMIVSWSSDDECYIVTIPELKGAMADGETPEEAILNAQIIIGEWIGVAKEEGREIPKPKFEKQLA
ncbi:MAG: type II toxin-antitoxin system HicB family antitoxin [Tissierellia bacterium]|nr:type II toxin-antitoxin system HicB family antitoxin [Tissierellia bacterium]